MPRYRLEKDFVFEAAHQLPNHDGKCKRLHGHSWKGTAILEGDTLHTEGHKDGMLVDYGDVGRVVNRIVDQYLDHYCLNDSLAMKNPTSENIAIWLFAELKPALPQLVAVRINETCTCRCEFRP